MRNSKEPAQKSEKGVILIAVLMVMIAVSIYLPGYVIWAVWDQRNLIRLQRGEEAKAIAQAGLNRAIVNLYIDPVWLDGEINQTTVHLPEPNSPDIFWTLYDKVNLGNGNYTVWIDYLQNPKTCSAGCSFLDKRMLVRSTGTIPSTITLPGAFSTLEEYVNYDVVRNLTWTVSYANLQPAINEAISNGWNNSDFGITDTILTENININTAMNFTIRGCFAPCFSYRSCADYHTTIRGNWTVTGGANINLSGITIE